MRKAELESAEARLTQPGWRNLEQRDNDCCVNITAPIDGVILEVLTRSEQAVSPGTKIAEIGDPRNLEIVVDLLSSDAAKIKPGAKVLITDWGGETDIEGTVHMVEPAAFTKVSSLGIEEQRVNIVIDPATVPENLGHGYRVLARLGIWQQDEVLRVPIAALFRTGGRWSVFVVEDGRANLRSVDIGQMNSSDAQVLGGIDADDNVISLPQRYSGGRQPGRGTLSGLERV